MPIANRGLLRADQADSEVGRLPGAQRQRGPMAGVGGTSGLRAVALLELLVQVVAQLHSTFYHSTSGVMGKAGPGEIAQLLWDSQRQLS